jgi:hypothetical protein
LGNESRLRRSGPESGFHLEQLNRWEKFALPINSREKFDGQLSTLTANFVALAPGMPH